MKMQVFVCHKMKKIIKEKKRIQPMVMSEDEFISHLMQQGIIIERPVKRENVLDINKNKFKIDEVISKYETNC